MSHRKLSDLKTDERRQVRGEVDTVAVPIAGDDWEPTNKIHNRSGCPDYGMCSTCMHAVIIKRQYGGWAGKCDRDEIGGPLDAVDRIEECSKYTKLGTMSLNDMYNIALLLDFNDKQIGF